MKIFEKLKVSFNFKDSHRKIFVAVFFFLETLQKKIREIHREVKNFNLQACGFFKAIPSSKIFTFSRTFSLNEIFSLLKAAA